MIRENQAFLNQVNVALDGALVFLSFLFGYWFRFYILPGGIPTVPFQTYVVVAVCLVPLHLFTYGVMGLYESHRKIRLYRELVRLFWANCLDFILLLMSFFLFRDVHFSRLALAAFFVAVNGSLGLKRIVLRKFLHRLRKMGFNYKNIIIVGSGDTAHQYVEEVNANPNLGYRILGYVAEGKNWKGVPYLGDFENLSRLLDRAAPDEVVAGLGVTEYEQMPKVIHACESTGTKLSLIPFYAKYMPANPQIDSFNGLPMINLRRIPLDNLGNAFMKRTMDIVGSLLLIIVSSPIMLFAAIGVKLSSPGPIIFKQVRVGLNKKEFYMYKFRSMCQDAERDGPRWADADDGRCTRFGAFLRRTRLDELPQIWNILKGDMSFVGPRPERACFYRLFEEYIVGFSNRLVVTPGLTGYAQVNGGYDLKPEEKIVYDMEYIEHRSVWMDLLCILKTIRVVFCGDGAR